MFIYFFQIRNKKLIIEQKTISIQHTDRSLEDIQFIWISNIGDKKISKEDIQKVCTNNTIIILSGYSRKKINKIYSKNIDLVSALAPVYFIWGPSDYNGNFRDLNALLLERKITILENTNALFETDFGSKFTLIGLDEVESNRDSINFALDTIQNNSLNILCSYTEIEDSTLIEFDMIQIYLFNKRNPNAKRNNKTMYVQLNNKNEHIYSLNLKD